MAQLVQVLLTDDISGEEADETVGFSLDGQGLRCPFPMNPMLNKKGSKRRKPLAVYRLGAFALLFSCKEI